MAWAFTGPIPGRASSCSLLAVLMLTLSPGASFIGAARFSTPAGAFEGGAAFAGAETGAVGAPEGADVLGAFGALTVTMPLRASIFPLLIPLTLLKSSTVLYGLPLMISCAVLGPTPGNDSRVLGSAVLRSTSPAGALACAAFAAAFPEAAGALSGFVSVLAGLGVADEGPHVTKGLKASIFLVEIPAFESSSTDLYGRFAMIFFAVADPTPLSPSRSCWDALLRSTSAFVSFPNAPVVPRLSTTRAMTKMINPRN